MIGATYPVLNSAGSDRNLSRALSTVVPVAAERPSLSARHKRFPFSKDVTPLSSPRFASSTPSGPPQKAIQYPETGPGSVQ
jgi:hypothetical protein